MTRANATKKDDDDVTDITCDAKKNEEERDPEEEAYEEIEEEVEVEFTTMDHISDFMNEVKEKRMEISRNSPCPCGSGNKYKHCHGAISAGSTV